VRVGTSTIDQGTGAWAAIGVLAALLERDRSGEGCVVDVSLYETAIGYLAYHLVGFLADGTVPAGEGTRFPMIAPYEALPTRDGALMVAGGNDRIFRALCAVVGSPELVDDPRFRTNPERVQNRDALAFQVKLDELIIKLKGAGNEIAGAEDLCDEDLEALHETYRKRAAQAHDSLEKRRSAR